ncbi:DNA-binding response regulator [Bordetella trematum]|uniref:Two-component response regulator n=1 Tax=Bordetella trematum TaxID=123899 RepID=A0A157Q298_9BORD|nr:response regulator transcription factor [Bordetella trematum]AUL47024.1 DNA-binding response regulator [Bordetella trematum]AZR93823.1 DNA-binding response regulator [Bordetella trematum]NNH18945.1 response regulator transcription factor [Bordetella trematum]QIM72406.1 response regulator transcription factor [Bordetella trematum]SAI01293.1 two-component response regulator [Bordetella trematum]
MLAENNVLPVGAPLLLVEDEPLLRERLQRILLQLEYPPSAISHAGTLAEARAAIARQRPAVALVDLGLPDGSGLELIRELFQADPAMLILVVSAWRSEEAILEALRAGASGYVLKERDDMEVGIAIRNLLNGGAPIDPFMARRLMQEFLGRVDPPAVLPSTGPLSPREMQVLRMVASGLGNREIAEQLHLSRHTVEQHIKNIYRKLTVTSRTKAVHAARAAGWLD